MVNSSLFQFAAVPAVFRCTIHRDQSGEHSSSAAAF
jgi:hypothetical protein